MRFITINSQNVVTSVRYGSKVVGNEIASATGNTGQIRQSNGTFITPAPNPVETETLEDKITRLEQQVQMDNLVVFEVLATIYEELVTQGAV